MTPEEKKAARIARAARRKAKKGESFEVDRTAYPEAYAVWAGNPYGRAPDFTRCCQSVFNDYRSKQCTRPNGHGPGNAWCKQHDPAVVAERRRKSSERWDSKHEDRISQMKWGTRGWAAYEALRRIADGHNNPRALASEILKRLEE